MPHLSAENGHHLTNMLDFMKIMAFVIDTNNSISCSVSELIWFYGGAGDVINVVSLCSHACIDKSTATESTSAATVSCVNLCIVVDVIIDYRMLHTSHIMVDIQLR